jgi:hypothetical protein
MREFQSIESFSIFGSIVSEIISHYFLSARPILSRSGVVSSKNESLIIIE